MAVTLNSKNVGDMVKIRENGALVDFIIIQKGLPSGIYDGSCNGVWVMRKLSHSNIQWGNNDDDFAASNILSWLENTYYPMLDADIRSNIKNAKLPYAKRENNNVSVITGASGAVCKCFLLSAVELGLTNSPTSSSQDFMVNEGGLLSYFADGDLEKKKAYDSNGTVVGYWTRSIYAGTYRDYYKAAIFARKDDQKYDGVASKTSTAYYARPVMILNNDLLVEGDGRVFANTAPSIPSGISVPGSIQGGSTITISWGGSTDAQGNLEGYKLERSVNNGGWQQIYQGGGTSTTNNVAYGTNTVMYRVKAYDSMGLESGYRTSNNVTVINNTAPGSPQGITVPVDVHGGSPLTISWGPSADAENNLAGYELERSVNGGTWTQIYRNAQQSFTDNITFGWQTVAYRVRAYDAYSAYSGYATSEARAVNNNRPPQIACDFSSGSDLGVKGEGFSVAYTVTDPDNNTGDVTVTEIFNGAKKRDFRPELGAVNNFAVEGMEFQCLPNGQHNISISASDGRAACTHTLTFTKTVTSAMITLETPLEADDQITACAIAVSGYIPQDAQFRVLVANNANDAEPKWENCTQLVKDGANYVFSNQLAENGYAFNFKITVSRGESGEGGYITSVQGGFQ